MAKTGVTGITRIINAFGYSMKGFRAALEHESAFRQLSALFIVLAPAAFWVGNSLVDYVLLVASLLLALIVELVNSAIEAVVDRISDDHHELSGRAKDMGSAAAFTSQMSVVFVWGMVIYKNFFQQ